MLYCCLQAEGLEAIRCEFLVAKSLAGFHKVFPATKSRHVSRERRERHQSVMEWVITRIHKDGLQNHKRTPDMLQPFPFVVKW